MHRLQCLRHRRFHHVADPLHPESRPWARNGAKAGIPRSSAKSETAKSILIVGAGPAGLEAGRALGQRGYKVTIADAASEPGGRVAKECRLPGLSAWGRVRDWRMGQIAKMANVELFLESRMTRGNRRRSSAPMRWSWRPARNGGATAWRAII